MINEGMMRVACDMVGMWAYIRQFYISHSHSSLTRSLSRSLSPSFPQPLTLVDPPLANDCCIVWNFIKLFMQISFTHTYLMSEPLWILFMKLPRQCNLYQNISKSMHFFSPFGWIYWLSIHCSCRWLLLIVEILPWHILCHPTDFM